LSVKSSAVSQTALGTIEASLLTWVKANSGRSSLWHPAHVAELQRFFIGHRDGGPDVDDPMLHALGDAAGAQARLTDVEERIRPLITSLAAEFGD
jgi:hypothetical protein